MEERCRMDGSEKRAQYGRRMRMMIRVILGVVLLIGMAALVLFLLILNSSKGELTPFYDEEGNVLQGSISERVYLEIGGVKNGMIIRGRNAEQPVLLFLSGGPGVPQYWLNEYYDNRLEDYFTVCWWDTPGEGISYDATLDPQDISIDRLEEDAVVVTEYLKERFGQDKIYLMAHSGGTPFALDLVRKHPELYHCYFAMGQVINPEIAGSRYTAGYHFMKPILEQKGDKRTLGKMEALVTVEEDGTVTPKDPETIGAKWESILLASGCATTREMRSDATGIFFPVMFAKCYTFPEKIHFWQGKGLYGKSAYKQVEYELNLEAEFEIPIYFINGYYDYTCPTSLVEAYYERVKAPDKDILILKDSAHSPLWEENERVLSFMREKAGRYETTSHS